MSDCTFSEIHRVWNEAFSNYSLNFQITVDQLSSMIGKKDLLPSCSFIAFDGDRPVGFVFNAVKVINGVKMAWNGGTGVSPDYQGRGIGKLIMEATMDIYQKELVEMATLEVITDNIHAVSLYERWGYETVHTSVSFSIDGKGNEINGEEYILTKGTVLDVKSLDFYNHQVAWESMCENIFNGSSMIIANQAGTPLGYALYKPYIGTNRQENIILFQLETNPTLSIEDQDMAFHRLVDCVFKRGVSGRTGDFISANDRAFTMLYERGFQRIASRYIMYKRMYG
nr:GNAT family N-acetyltransferase [Bacillus mesophilus]